MRIEDMHYEFKSRLNELDSNKYRGLLIPEIDWKLNQAQLLAIRMISNPMRFNGHSFEINQRATDDLRSIVINQEQGTKAERISGTEFYAPLPNDYYFGVSSYALMAKGQCRRKGRCYAAQHDDLHEENAFTKSSFEWREVNSRLFNKGQKVFSDGTFSIERVYFNYLAKPKYMHFAQGFEDGEYSLPDGTTLTGKQDSTLPDSIHPFIVSLAVTIATGDLKIEDYPIKQDILNYDK